MKKNKNVVAVNLDVLFNEVNMAQKQYDSVVNQNKNLQRENLFLKTKLEIVKQTALAKKRNFEEALETIALEFAQEILATIGEL